MLEKLKRLAKILGETNAKVFGENPNAFLFRKSLNARCIWFVPAGKDGHEWCGERWLLTGHLLELMAKKGYPVLAGYACEWICSVSDQPYGNGSEPVKAGNPHDAVLGAFLALHEVEN